MKIIFRAVVLMAITFAFINSETLAREGLVCESMDITMKPTYEVAIDLLDVTHSGIYTVRIEETLDLPGDNVRVYEKEGSGKILDDRFFIRFSDGSGKIAGKTSPNAELSYAAKLEFDGIVAWNLNCVPVEAYIVGRFSLYEKPHHFPDPMCDHGTELILDNATIMGKTAFIREFVTGFCELYVVPNERYAALKLSGYPCGSAHYVGYRHTSEGKFRIEVIDHRRRRCMDVVPAQIILKETQPDGTVRVRYSADILPVQPPKQKADADQKGIKGRLKGD